nr:photosynthesis system II assembly factor Ycf48 [Desertifilum tharense]
MERTLKILKVMQPIVKIFQRFVTLLAIVVLCTSCGGYLPDLSYNPWKVVQLPSDKILLDIGFTGNPAHGWLVGSEGTLLESNDGGETWQLREVDLDDEKVRFTSVSFSGQEGWIVGEPSILLHTTDEGKSWSRIPLSPKLPGKPNQIFALGPQSAEMTTDVGAIYQTQDGGSTWKAMVQEAVGVFRNISRSPEGQYVTVSAKGNFYSTWEPGQQAWTPHNRNSSRRVQNMGFLADGRLWMLARGGQIQFTNSPSTEDWADPLYPEKSTSWGLLDLSYRTPEEIWVTGGSGNLLCSLDGGKTWQKDREVENVASNFYKVIFLSPEKGFIIGQNGVLLKYQEPAQAA